MSEERDVPIVEPGIKRDSIVNCVSSLKLSCTRSMAWRSRMTDTWTSLSSDSDSGFDSLLEATGLEVAGGA